jgi:hypothetical protein
MGGKFGTAAHAHGLHHPVGACLGRALNPRRSSPPTPAPCRNAGKARASQASHGESRCAAQSGLSWSRSSCFATRETKLRFTDPATERPIACRSTREAERHLAGDAAGTASTGNLSAHRSHHPIGARFGRAQPTSSQSTNAGAVLRRRQSAARRHRPGGKKQDLTPYARRRPTADRRGPHGPWWGTDDVLGLRRARGRVSPPVWSSPSASILKGDWRGSESIRDRSMRTAGALAARC